jgi:RNA polymerase sigma-70 factor (ECF subfamily)
MGGGQAGAFSVSPGRGWPRLIGQAVIVPRPNQIRASGAGACDPGAGAEKGGHYVVSEKLQTQREDADLVTSFLRDDSWASAAIWERYHPLVRRILCRAAGPTASDVDDLIQEVFIRLYRKLPTLRDRAALRSFVLAITTRVVQAELRSRWIKRWLRLSDDGAVPEPVADDTDHEAREALDRFYAILDGLRPKQRAVFTLRCIEGLELVEVAAAAGVSLATIKRWLPRITKRVHTQAARDPVLAAYVASRGPLVVLHG